MRGVGISEEETGINDIFLFEDYRFRKTLLKLRIKEKRKKLSKISCLGVLMVNRLSN